jgi:D-serine deaminase-like pyridoxal phosphate-dependent protein
MPLDLSSVPDATVDVLQRLPARGRGHALARRRSAQVPDGTDLRVGDLVGCGISHPGTTFDRWQLLLAVDDDYTIVNAPRAFF